MKELSMNSDYRKSLASEMFGIPIQDVTDSHCDLMDAAEGAAVRDFTVEHVASILGIDPAAVHRLDQMRYYNNILCDLISRI